jgi:uncharacterized protein
VPAGLPGRVLDLAHALREAGVPVAVSDDLDAMRALAAVDLLQRSQLREALASTMVKSPGHRVAFDTLFDLHFPARDGMATDTEGGGGRDVGEFLAELVDRLLAGDDAAVRSLAHEAVGVFGRVEGPAGVPGFFAYRVYRNINLAGILRRLMAESGMDEADPLEAQLARDEFEARLRHFREEVDAELRRRAAAERGPEAVARSAVRPLPEDLDFFQISAEEQAAMRRHVHTLARRLATRLAVKRRRGRTGRLDVRRTIRTSLGTGGVPIDPAFRTKRVQRPELVVLTDVSGSVAAFARFTLMLCHALTGHVSKVRSFAFIDTVDEVTDLFAGGDFADAVARLSSEAQVVWLDGHSDYGHALERFHARYHDAVTQRSTVLVLGDARNNYRAANAWVLAELQRRARRLYWLNPEPAAQWDTGDSVASEYARHTDRMVECRNLRQLTAFIEAIV